MMTNQNAHTNCKSYSIGPCKHQVEFLLHITILTFPYSIMVRAHPEPEVVASSITFSQQL